ncbi:hypothetical protein [Metabacillus litoralis]|uniref:hypothetical protein n=1 Tax=Metabacillus litoralis TaxID=152268 RepID=UPI00203D2AA0|nr:hypothetical protein [Metabacillus litoralis]MCM3163309.1 hypothetical protein [Metabacillus litoralis]
MGRVKSDLNLVNPWKNQQTSLLKMVLYGVGSGVVGAICCAFGMLGGFGFVISALATFPIILASLVSISSGVISYFIIFLLLCVIQPSEAYVYLMTQGLLGVVMGIGFKVCKKQMTIALSSGIALFLGIIFILTVAQFPVLGPSVGPNIGWVVILSILLFSIVYSWIWVIGVTLALNLFQKRELRKKV